MATYPPLLIQMASGLFSPLLSLFTKTNPKRIILTSFHGNGYRGNTKVIFEELCKHPHFQPVWLSRNKNIVSTIKEKFGTDRAEFFHTYRGLKKVAEAGSILFTHGTSDYPFLYLPRTALRIQTYHGLPTKRGEYLRPKSDKEPSWFHRKILEYRFKPITHFLSSSPVVTEIFSKRFRIPENRFLETGYPAYDTLINQTFENQKAETLFTDIPETDHLILYAPTFRLFSKTKWFPFVDFDPLKLAGFLDRYKITIALRSHPNESVDINEHRQYTDRIISADHKTIEDINTILPLLSGIITDYSSIYIEGLLLDIPAIFIPYDLDQYERGLALPYDDITPGPKVKQYDQFQQSLENIVQGTEGSSEERSGVRDLFFSFQDGNSTDRVIQFLEKKLLNKR